MFTMIFRCFSLLKENIPLKKNIDIRQQDDEELYNKKLSHTFSLLKKINYEVEQLHGIPLRYPFFKDESSIDYFLQSVIEFNTDIEFHRILISSLINDLKNIVSEKPNEKILSKNLQMYHFYNKILLQLKYINKKIKQLIGNFKCTYNQIKYCISLPQIREYPLNFPFLFLTNFRELYQK